VAKRLLQNQLQGSADANRLACPSVQTRRHGKHASGYEGGASGEVSNPRQPSDHGGPVRRAVQGSGEVIDDGPDHVADARDRQEEARGDDKVVAEGPGQSVLDRRDGGGLVIDLIQVPRDAEQAEDGYPQTAIEKAADRLARPRADGARTVAEPFDIEERLKRAPACEGAEPYANQPEQRDAQGPPRPRFQRSNRALRMWDPPKHSQKGDRGDAQIDHPARRVACAGREFDERTGMDQLKPIPERSRKPARSIAARPRCCHPALLTQYNKSVDAKPIRMTEQRPLRTVAGSGGAATNPASRLLHEDLKVAAALDPPAQDVPGPPPPITARSARWLWPILLLAALSALGFAIVLVHDVARGRALKFDSTLLLALRQPGHLDVPIGPPWLQQSAIDLSALGGFTLLWLLGGAATGFMLYVNRRAEAAWLTASIAGASLLNTALKLYLHRPRPDLVPHLARVSNASFPSGHAMISAAIYLTIGAMLAETQARASARAYLMGFAAFLAIAIGCSRVYLGVHWPSDVLAGWCFGSLWALIVFVANRMMRRKFSRPG